MPPRLTCRTCFRDISSLLCTDCFQRGDHEGHDVTFRTNYNFAPVCDCGAIDLYKDTEDGHPDCCLDHPRHPDPAKNIQAKWNAGSTDSAAVTEEFVRALYDVFVVCIEYIIETFQSAPPPENYGKLPKDLKEMTTAWGLNYTCLDDAAKRAEGPWSVAVFTDERHNEPELLRQMQHATGADMDDCQDWVTEMDTLVSSNG
jgi:E3 ubiquitin-protein ligase UBR1